MIDVDKAFEGRWRIKSKIYFADERKQQEIKALCRDFFEAGIMLGKQPSIKMEKPAANLFQRSLPFSRSVFTTENEQRYGKQMLMDFYEYWSEPNPSQTKMRFELQKTWDVNRRLARWARNNFNRYDRQQTTINRQRLDKFADIITD